MTASTEYTYSYDPMNVCRVCKITYDEKKCKYHFFCQKCYYQSRKIEIQKVKRKWYLKNRERILEEAYYRRQEKKFIQDKI